MGIELKDPFLQDSDAKYEDILHAFLNENETNILTSEKGKWWSESDYNMVWKFLNEFGLNDLEKYCSSEGLIQYFEGKLKDDARKKRIRERYFREIHKKPLFN